MSGSVVCVWLASFLAFSRWFYCLLALCLISSFFAWYAVSGDLLRFVWFAGFAAFCRFFVTVAPSSSPDRLLFVYQPITCHSSACIPKVRWSRPIAAAPNIFSHVKSAHMATVARCQQVIWHLFRLSRVSSTSFEGRNCTQAWAQRQPMPRITQASAGFV